MSCWIDCADTRISLDDQRSLFGWFMETRQAPVGSPGTSIQLDGRRDIRI